MKKLLLSLVLLAFACASFAQTPSPARQLLEKVVARYDPQGKASQMEVWIKARHTYPGFNPRYSDFIVKPGQGYIWSRTHRNGHYVTRSLRNGRYEATIDGSATFSQAERDSLHLSEENIKSHCDYYLYAFCMPRNLLDPRAILRPEPEKVVFQGKSCLALHISYSEALDREKWIYYIDPSDFRLLGIAFYYKDPKQDGEYGIFEGEIEIGGVKMVQKMKFYEPSGKFMGEDALELGWPLKP